MLISHFNIPAPIPIRIQWRIPVVPCDRWRYSLHSSYRFPCTLHVAIDCVDMSCKITVLYSSHKSKREKKTLLLLRIVILGTGFADNSQAKHHQCNPQSDRPFRCPTGNHHHICNRFKGHKHTQQKILSHCLFHRLMFGCIHFTWLTLNTANSLDNIRFYMNSSNCVDPFTVP